MLFLIFVLIFQIFAENFMNVSMNVTGILLLITCTQCCQIHDMKCELRKCLKVLARKPPPSSSIISKCTTIPDSEKAIYKLLKSIK